MALPGLEGYESDGSPSSSSSSSSPTDDTKILPFTVTAKGENEQAAPKQDESHLSTTSHPVSVMMQNKTGPETESECSSLSDDESSDIDLSIDEEAAVAALIGSNAAAEDEEEDCMEVPRTKNEIMDAPIEPTSLDVDIEGRELSIAGSIISVIMSEGSVVVMSAPGLPPLDEDTVLCCTMAASGNDSSSSSSSIKSAEKGKKLGETSVLGCISEVFGPVSRPHYFIRCDPKRLSGLKEVGASLEPGSQVMSVGGMTSYLSQEALLAQKGRGCDASDAFDEELPPNLVEFSDDEKEMVAKGGRRKKRSSNGKGKGGGDKDSGHSKRNQSSSNCYFDSRAHPQCRLQQKMPINYQHPSQQQPLFSQPQLYNRDQQPTHVLQHPWVPTQHGGFTPPIQQPVGPSNYQYQQEIRGHEQFHQQMHLQQHFPNLQETQWSHHSTMLCEKQPKPPNFKQASNQYTVWNGLQKPPQPLLPSTPYHALNLVPSSYHDTLREGQPTFNSSSPKEPVPPQEPVHD